jgi:hypothetical protein
MQCLLEHGTVPQVHRLMQFLVDNASEIGRDPNGCSVIGKAISTGLRADQVRVARAVYDVPGLLKTMGQSKHGHYVMKSILQVVKQNSVGETATAQGPKVKPGHRQGTAAASSGVDSTTSKERSRGKGGGKTAQEETEVRDLLESLRAACLRRSPARIAKALSRVQNVFSKPIASAPLVMEAAQACEQAQQIMWSLSMERGAIA